MVRLVSLALALVLGACATGSTTVSTTTLASSAYAARSAYAAALILATQYVELPRCNQPASPPICSDSAIVSTMRSAERAADSGTMAAETAVRSLAADPALAQVLVAAATQSVGAFKSIAEAYAPKGAK